MQKIASAVPPIWMPSSATCCQSATWLGPGSTVLKYGPVTQLTMM